MDKLESEFAYKNETFDFKNKNKSLDKLWYKIFLMKKGSKGTFSPARSRTRTAIYDRPTTDTV